MHYFTLLTFQHWILALGLGLVSIIGIYIAWYGYDTRRFEDLDVSEEGKPTEVPGAQHHPLNPFLIFVFAGIVLWIFFYVIIVGLFTDMPIT